MAKSDTLYHHIYPFNPWGLHGGTLRLRTAVDASLLEGAATVSWWDHSQLAWRSDTSVESIGAPDPAPAPEESASAANRLKRSIFPFTLWESGRKPCSHVAHVLNEQPEASIVLHTSFLAPLAAGLRQSGRRVVVDVHDAVFRGHLDDSERASGAMRAIRRTYAETVRRRERRALAAADWLAVAGWDDAQRLMSLGLTRATWAPTGLEARLSPMPQSDRLCVGLLGNFYHGPTAQAASDLIASPLGRDSAVEVVLAGIGSEHYRTPRRVRSLGPVASVDEFYAQVHATVVPVSNGTGMKCKLAEAALAGKSVITTPQGAAGYPPSLNKHFVVTQSSELTAEIVQAAVEHHNPQAVRDAFYATCGLSAAVATYAEVLKASV